MFTPAIRRICLAVCLLASTAACLAFTVDGYHYTGTIDKTIAVQMNLHFAGENISGDCMYHSSGTPLTLAGAIDAEVNISFTEYIGIETGGTFYGAISADHQTITGMWTSADDARQLPFTLHAIAEYRYIESQRDSGSYGYTYPAFLRPTTLQQKLNKFFCTNAENGIKPPADTLQEVTPGQYRMVADIVFLDAKLLSLRYASTLDYGAALPAYAFETAHYALTTTAYTLIRDAGIFNAKSAYANTLLDRVKADAKTQAGEEEFNDGATFEDLVYTAAPGGVTFIYPSAAGSAHPGYFVTLPYADLQPFIAPKSPLLRFVVGKK